MLCIFINLPYTHVWNIVTHVWAGAPNCYLQLLDKLQKQICRTVGPPLAVSLEPLARCRNVASLSLFLKTLKKLYGPFLWMGFNCLKARVTLRRSLLFTTKSPEIPGTHFIDLERMKG